MYAPDRHDHQTPHDQDELYIVAKGTGIFINGERRHSFQPGDAMFVRAGVEHRFKNFTGDLLVWVILCSSSETETAV
jgi:mannose-6-phosphate isomerase-like protein (cupin superfamily)